MNDNNEWFDDYAEDADEISARAREVTLHIVPNGWDHIARRRPTPRCVRG